ncbi:MULTISPECIES: alpha/beta hydrolase [unclassified Pseudoalteromonas]|uniref:alpha/beta hydrolase n=1 Tax=unclassified Pseudoalteromonas TaxID=194690 RepID=UPI001BA5EB99|nr:MULTISPECIES: alpha/beta hydrolase [unclassified Pseudoalteromonas]MCG7555305.1 alpha/beta hydrolase [Pseudoalteromonas sp. Of11M-6]QUI68814.1 alpha/beta hydrolase [Pseudoalteromonas sp. M8]
MLRPLLLLLCLPFVLAAETVIDPARDRAIPVETHLPTDTNPCSKAAPCPVALLSAGYGVSHTDYQFLVKTLNRAGYLVITVGHELATDPPLSVEGNLYETRAENWQRGADTLVFIHDYFKPKFTTFDFEHILLIGHSNGGDISAWLINHGAKFVNQIITLDHRRVPLPRSLDVKVLSIRASDFPADKGVLPSRTEKHKYQDCVVTIASAKHNDMTDEGPSWLTDKIAQILADHLAGIPCLENEKANDQ